MNTADFNETLWEFYSKNARDSLPWRMSEPNGTFDPYKILVSEIMLQQTQVSRVVGKYQEWLSRFPDLRVLAAASLADVLSVWSGLGYNRRAKFLHDAAKLVMQDFNGAIPQTQAELDSLPGIGKNTAGAILAYAHNQPAIFIETNIRTVFLFHFYQDAANVADSELLELIEQAIDTENPREWYWALMDYGTYIKKIEGNYSKNSKHHVKQSAFKGSKREVRGKVLKILTRGGPISQTALCDAVEDERLSVVLDDLEKEGLLRRCGATIRLAD